MTSREYYKAVEILFNRVPAFAEAYFKDQTRLNGEELLPTVVFGSLGQFLTRLIKHESDTEEAAEILADSFKLLNEMINSSDINIANLAVVGTFEMLSDTPEGITAARQYLSGNALQAFEHVVSLWGAQEDQ